MVVWKNVGVAVVLVAIFVASAMYGQQLHAPCDDTYIYLVYVKNFCNGNGLTYNGDRVQGFTSALWMAMLMAGSVLPWDYPVVARRLSLLSGLFLLIATYFVGRRLGLSRVHALVAPLLLAAMFDFQFWIHSGMETVFFAGMLVLVLGIAVTRELDSAPRSWGLAVLMALLVLARPEGVLVAVLVAAYYARVGRVTDGVLLLRRTAMFLLPVFFALRLYYGSWLPNTYYAKAGAGLSNVPQGFLYLFDFVRASAPVVVPFVAVMIFQARKLTRPAMVLSLVLLFWCVNVVRQGGDNLVGFRALLPIAPVAYLLLAQGLKRVNGTAVLAGALLLGCLHTWLYRDLNVIASSWRVPISHQIGQWRSEYDRRKETGMFLKDELGPDGLVALNAAGIIPYYSELQTIDMLGLNDAHIARKGDRDRKLTYGHQAGDGDYVVRRRPDVIIFGGLGGGRNKYFLGDRQVWNNLTFRRGYAPLDLPAEGLAFKRRAVPLPVRR